MKALVTLLAVIALASCATPPPPEVYPHAEKPYFTEWGGNLSEVEKSPDRYVGLFHSITGQVSEIKENEYAAVMAVLIKTNFSVSEPTYISFIVRLKKPLYDKSGLVTYTRISKGDFISLIGFFAGATSGTNAYGTTVNYLRFDAVAARINFETDYAMPQYGETYKQWARGQLYDETSRARWDLHSKQPNYEDYDKSSPPIHIDAPTPVLTRQPSAIKQYFDSKYTYITGSMSEGIGYKDSDCTVLIGTKKNEVTSAAFYFDTQPSFGRFDDIILAMTGARISDINSVSKSENQWIYKFNDFTVFLNFEDAPKEVPIIGYQYRFSVLITKQL